MSDTEDSLGTVSSRSRWSSTPEKDHSDDEELFIGETVDNRGDQDDGDDDSQDSVSESDHDSTATVTAAKDREHNLDIPAERASPAPLEYNPGVHETSTANKVNKGEATSEVLQPERQQLPSTLEGCLEALGFKDDKDCVAMRKNFRKDLNVCAISCGNQGLKPHANRDAFDKMVRTFLG